MTGPWLKNSLPDISQTEQSKEPSQLESVTGVGKSSQLLARDRLLVTKSAKKIVHALALANGTEVIETVIGTVEIVIVVAVIVVAVIAVAVITIAAAEIVTSVIAGDKTTDGTKKKATIDIGIEAEAATVNIVVMTDVDLLLFRSLAFFVLYSLNLTRFTANLEYLVELHRPRNNYNIFFTLEVASYLNCTW